MLPFESSTIKIASRSDIDDIVQLLNKSYRGESSREGWTNELDLITGETRTNRVTLEHLFQQPNTIFLKYVPDDKQIVGCVNLQLKDNKLYLGMFAVMPKMQNAGIGKQLLAAAELYARYIDCSTIYMSVLSARADLIKWYERRGYYKTGEELFFEEDELTGKHLQPLYFIMMEKKIYLKVSVLRRKKSCESFTQFATHIIKQSITVISQN